MNLETLKSKKTIKELIDFGIINFNKPADWTSFDVSHYVCKVLNLKKTSHFGTLDPMVTGVLPVALARACKLTGFFLGEDKEYEGIMRIHEERTLEEIQKVIDEKFMGVIIQLPPVRSSVKRQEREREIKSFKLLSQEDKKVYFRVECQGGTYVRKLIHDLGEEMGIGAHMIGLKRIRAGIFLDKNMVTREEFDEAVHKYREGNEELLRKMIIPAEIVSHVYPIVEIKKEEVERVLHGAPINLSALEKKEKMEKGKKICIFCGERMIGMFRVVNEGKIFAVSEFVLQPI